MSTDATNEKEISVVPPVEEPQKKLIDFADIDSRHRAKVFLDEKNIRFFEITIAGMDISSPVFKDIQVIANFEMMAFKCMENEKDKDSAFNTLQRILESFRPETLVESAEEEPQGNPDEDGSVD